MQRALGSEHSISSPPSQCVTLQFAQVGGRTHLARQFFSYPFHITRPFYLDRTPAGLATIYLQSASGGIYSGDQLQMTIEAAAGAQCHVTSQSATIVHDCRDSASRYTARIQAEAGAFVGLLNDPLILFPGAAIEMQTEVRMAPDARVILSDGLVLHDPGNGCREPFDLFSSQLAVCDPSGRRLLVDRLRLSGADYVHLAPHGYWRMAGNLFALGRFPSVSLGELEEGVAASGGYAGATRLPNDAGLALRVLASDGAQLVRVLTRAWEMLFAGLFGTLPGRRRK